MYTPPVARGCRALLLVSVVASFIHWRTFLPRLRAPMTLRSPPIGKVYQGNGQPFPDGAKMAKIRWIPKKQETSPGQPIVPGTQHDVDFMVKDSKRFADSGGWGYATFEYEASSSTFRPGDTTDSPPQANDAKCG